MTFDAADKEFREWWIKNNGFTKEHSLTERAALTRLAKRAWQACESQYLDLIDTLNERLNKAESEIKEIQEHKKELEAKWKSTKDLAIRNAQEMRKECEERVHSAVVEMREKAAKHFPIWHSEGLGGYFTCHECDWDSRNSSTIGWESHIEKLPIDSAPHWLERKLLDERLLEADWWNNRNPAPERISAILAKRRALEGRVGT